MTENEAKTKWCPFARALTLGISEIPTSNGTRDFRCIGSACMAWQWMPQHQENEYSKENEPPAGNGWKFQKGSAGWWHRTITNKTFGFCGLTCKP